MIRTKDTLLAGILSCVILTNHFHKQKELFLGLFNFPPQKALNSNKKHEKFKIYRISIKAVVVSGLF